MRRVPEVPGVAELALRYRETSLAIPKNNIMKCKEVKRKLSAYLDGEMKERERKTISEHLEKCPDCKKELTILSQQDKFLERVEAIEPSVNFRAKFWQKVTRQQQVIASEQSERGNLFRRLKPAATWLPVPAMGFLIVLVIFHLITFSFSVSAKSQDLRNKIVSCAIKNLIIPSHPLNPISLLNFCKGCCETLCKCAQNQGVSSECVCGGCSE